MGLFRDAPAREAMELQPLTIVYADGDWVIALEDVESFYEHGPHGGTFFEADPGEFADWHYGCQNTISEGYFGSSYATGRTYCACGYWYDRDAWGM